MVDPITFTITTPCPMCGQPVAAVNKQCPACGDPIPLPPLVKKNVDVGIAVGVSILSVLICGFWIYESILMTLSPPTGMYGSMMRDQAYIGAAIITAWLWGPPVIRVLIHNPLKTASGHASSRWRVFWQTQAVMYAISPGFCILCQGVCTGR